MLNPTNEIIREANNPKIKNVLGKIPEELHRKFNATRALRGEGLDEAVENAIRCYCDLPQEE